MAKFASYGIAILVGYGLAMATPFALERMGYEFDEPQVELDEFQICPVGAEARWYTQQIRREFPVQSVMECQTSDGNAHGPLIKWEAGNLLSVTHMRKGMPEGPMFMWPDSGGMLIMPDSSGGKARHSVRWNAQGVKVSETTFVDDSERSVTEMWYDNGRQKLRIETVGDNPDGQSESWYESGLPRARGRYRGGRRVGEWDCWDPAGENRLRVRYADDGTILDWTGSEQTVVEWTRFCLQGCPGERIDELNNLEPGRQCNITDEASVRTPN